MALLTLSVYRTTIVNGVPSGVSQLVTITINDANNNGAIDTAEWQEFTGSPNGWLRGTVPGTQDPALWSGTAGNTQNGSLFTSVQIESNAQWQALRSTLVQNKFSVNAEDLAVCFLAGTMIATPDGEKAVETLRVGDLVMTLDNGPQPLVWVGQSMIGRDTLDRSPQLRPVSIAEGALGNGLPRREVCVSPQHRVLLTDADGSEYLVSARHLQMAGMAGIRVIKDDEPFTLIHFAFATHQIVLAEGAPMESFFTGQMAVRALEPGARDALFTVFPALETGENPMSPVRPFIGRKDVAAVLASKAVKAA